MEKNLQSVNKKQKNTDFKWVHDFEGSNFRMTEIQASIGRYQLKNLDKQIKKRNKIAKFFLKKT